MTFLPIVGRELRVAARRGATYWIRLAVAAEATLVGVGAWVASEVDTRVKFGEALFWGLATVALIHCVLAGRRSTADCLSQEKREGTMGLLFLTDLKGFDVVVGKLVATSLNGFYGLFAIFPVLAVPLLVGGMTSGEFWRMVVALVVTFVFSLSIGVFCSAGSKEYKEAIGRNFLLLMAPSVLLPMVGLFAYAVGNTFDRSFFLACPFFTFRLCKDTLYRAYSEDYRASVVVMLGLSALLVSRACRLLPISWQDVPTAGRARMNWWRTFKRWITYGEAGPRAAFRKFALDQNAYFWLSARERLKPIHVWGFMVAAVVWWVAGWVLNGAYWLAEESDIAMALILTATLKLWLTNEAGQRLAVDREAGGMELLLCTPLTVDDYLRGQYLALRRQFLKPFIGVIAGLLGLMTLALVHNAASGWFPWPCAIILFAADAVAITLVGIWMALRAKTHTRATLATASRVLILPWIALGVVLVTDQALIQFNVHVVDFSLNAQIAIWFCFGLATDAWFGWRAWRSIHTEFRDLAMQRYGVRAASVVKVASKTPRRLRRPALVAASVAVVLACVAWARSRPHFPAAVNVTLTSNDANVKAFPGIRYGMFLILPDRSLWRWGYADNLSRDFAASPQQIGDHHDWLKVQANPSFGVSGLRADGTIWEWGDTPDGQFQEPKQIGYEYLGEVKNWKWKDIASAGDIRVALRSDGTMWAWTFAHVGQNDLRLIPIGNETNWDKLVQRNRGEIVALQNDGTAWSWGNYFRNFSYPAPKPTTLPLGQYSNNWFGKSQRGWPHLTIEADGTIWTQGVDYGLEPEVSMWRTLQFISHGAILRPNLHEPLPAYSASARPLMRLKGP